MKLWMTTASAVAALAMAAPALADNNNGFGVGTSVVTGQYLDVYGGVATSVSAYRMGGDSSGNYTTMNDVAPVGFDNCARSGAPGCISASQGGTTGPGFNQTFSTSNSGLVFDGGYGPWTVGASTYADLATGKLGASGSTNYYQTALTVARFVDTLTFNVEGADASTVTNIAVKFQLDGSLSTPDAHGASGLGTPYATVNNTFGFGGATGSVFFEQAAANRRYGQEEQRLRQLTSQNGWVSYSWDSISPGLTQFTGIYALSGISQALGIGSSLSAYASTGASFDYGNTSSLSLVLPTNVTFTSASNTFLSGVAGQSAVPEPSTWAMVIVGFGLMGHAMRRRTASRVVLAA